MKRRNFLQGSVLLGASTLFAGATGFPIIKWKGNAFDLIIKNGAVIDGSGKGEFFFDIGVKDGKIISVGNLQDASYDIVIDASGLKVAPGFIDIHSHTDLDLIPNPKAESKIRQGITTECCGQDGFSEGPVGGLSMPRILNNFKEEYGEDLPWRTLGEFLDDFSKRKFSVNLASMVGFGTIRAMVVGMDDREASPGELKQMKYEVEKAIIDGAIGMSTGLEYTPGSFASTEELIELCKAAPLKGRLYSTHMRNEDNTVLEAVDEAIKIAKDSGGRLLISHLKVSGKSNWHKADAVIEKIDKAIAEGLEVHADRYTYVAYHTDLANLFPLWSRDGGNSKFVDRLKDKTLTDSIKLYVEKKVSNLDGDWNGVQISNAATDELRHYQGKTIKEIAEIENSDGFNTAVNILLKSNGGAMMVGFGMEEESTEKILRHPHVMISSDAGSHAPYPPMNKTIAHPRAYGTFPRAIAKYVRERKICSLEEMIRKMTSLPAGKLRLSDRGLIKEGLNADLVVFDYDKIQDKATFINSHQYPEGIPYVIVNGKIVIDKGEHTGEFPGKVIKA